MSDNNDENGQANLWPQDKKMNNSKPKNKRQPVIPTEIEVRQWATANDIDADLAVQQVQIWKQSDWKDGKGNPILNWKNKLATYHQKGFGIFPDHSRTSNRRDGGSKSKANYYLSDEDRKLIEQAKKEDREFWANLEPWERDCLRLGITYEANFMQVKKQMDWRDEDGRLMYPKLREEYAKLKSDTEKKKTEAARPAYRGKIIPGTGFRSDDE